MELKRRKTRYNTIIAIVISLLLILSVVGIYQFKRANDLALAVENQYVHAFHEMTDYVKDVDVLLKKSMLASTPVQMSSISSDIFMQSAAAKANLALLPVSELDLSGTSKFLSQVGDYTSYLSSKVISAGEITQEEFENLEKLSDHAESVSDQLEQMQTRLNAGQVTFGTTAGMMTAYAEGEISIGSGMESLEKSFQDYPSLIYDGPFSEHIETLSPVMLEGKATFNREEARSIAVSFLGESRAVNLQDSDDGGGVIPTYNFTASGPDDRQITISVTRQGGYVLYMLDNRSISRSNLGIDEAMKQAESFLRKQGFYNMRSSYYETNDNMATINYAAIQNGVVLYSDLIKVKVALDNGEIIGYESKGYLMNHKIREIPEGGLTPEEARQHLNSHLSVDSISLAMIPLDSMREVLCYECKGTYKDKNFLVYLNTQTGQEEQILMLLESENGILTV